VRRSDKVKDPHVPSARVRTVDVSKKLSAEPPTIENKERWLPLAIYLRCFAAVEMMRVNRHRISMTLSIPARGPAPRVLSLIRFFESDGWGPRPRARMLTVINTDL
jgi:hypothetical protein